jgi:hypothetical protein
MFWRMKTDNVALQLSEKTHGKSGRPARENSNFDGFQAKYDTSGRGVRRKCFFDADFWSTGRQI